MPPPCFRIVVERELGPRYTAAFDAVTVSARNGMLEITGPIIDASNLRRLLHASPASRSRLCAASSTQTRPRGPEAQPGNGQTTTAQELIRGHSEHLSSKEA